MTTTTELKATLQQLPESERAELAEFLLGSLTQESSALSDWDEELRRREKIIQEGSVEGEPADVVLERLHRKYS
jgi:hypothetical protein